MSDSSPASRQFRLFLLAGVTLAIVEGLLVALVGRGPVLVVLPWAEIVAESFTILAALCIAYVCLGRYRVLGEPGTLWVGLGFFAYAVFAIIYLLVYPPLVNAVAVHPNVNAWPFHYKWTAFGLLLIAAAFAGRPGPARRDSAVPVLLFAAVGLLCVFVAIATFALGPYLPPLVVGNRFTPLNVGWIAVAAALFALGAFLGLRRSGQPGRAIVGYAAIVELIIAARLASDIAGGQLFDVTWYFNRVMLIGSFSLMLVALLNEYVGLLRLQQEAAALTQRRSSELRATLDSMADAVFALDVQANVVDVNPRGVELLGFSSRQEALRPLAEYQQFLRASHIDGRPLQPEEYSGARALRGETFRGFLERAQMWDGRELTLEVSAAPIRGSDGGVAGAVVVLRDVTELEWARTRVTVARVATAVAQALSLPDLVEAVVGEAASALQADMVLLYSADEARRQLRLIGSRNLSPAVAERLQALAFDAPALSSRAVTTGLPQILEDLAQVPPELTVARELGERFGYGSLVSIPLRVHGHTVGAMTYADRQPRRYSPVELQTIDTIGEIIGVGLENARLYEETEAERQRLMAIVESSPGGILLFQAPEGRIVLANRAVEQLVGVPIDHEAPMAEHPHVYGLCRPDGSAYPAEELPSNRALRGEVVVGEELLIARPGAPAVPILANAAPIRDAGGRVTGAVVVLQDISRIKELERQREEWTSVIAHDLRQPVTIISSYAQLVQRLLGRPQSPEDEAKLSTQLGHIRTAAANLNKMIEDLLDASRIEARRLKLERRAVDLPNLVWEVVERTAEVTSGHPVGVEVKDEIPAVEADPQRVEQVLGNLLSNAAKYGEPETEIRVEVERRAGEVQVSVTNRGAGISPEDLPKLFTRFHRTRQAQAERRPGIGLGLYITRGLVEAHGGRIWAESTPGEATAFRFTLPIEVAAEQGLRAA